MDYKVISVLEDFIDEKNIISIIDEYYIELKKIELGFKLKTELQIYNSSEYVIFSDFLYRHHNYCPLHNIFPTIPIYYDLMLFIKKIFIETTMHRVNLTSQEDLSKHYFMLNIIIRRICKVAKDLSFKLALRDAELGVNYYAFKLTLVREIFLQELFNLYPTILRQEMS